MTSARPSGRWSWNSTASAALIIHLGIRATAMCAVLIAVAAHPLHTGGFGGDLGAALGKSDGVWYLGIAHHGYGPPPPIGPNGVYTHLTSLAFFPLYPLLIRLVAFTGLPYLGAALVVTAVAGCVGAVAIVDWARSLVGDRAALALLVVWELLPSSIVLGMAYSEALFVAAAAICLSALQRRAWLIAGAAAGVGGLTRPTGGCLVVAIVVAAVVDVGRDRRTGPVTAASLARPVVSVLVGVAGLATSLIHVAVVTGRLDGWFWLERTVWNSGFDAGSSGLHNYGQLITGGRAEHRLPEIVAGVTVLAAIAVAGWAWASHHRTDAPAASYSITAAVLAIGERGYFYVKPRLVFVAFPLLLPLGSWLAERSRRWLITAGVLVGAASMTYNAYLLTGWTRAL